SNYSTIPQTISEDRSERDSMAEASCRSWYEGDALLEAYHDTEWCKVTHDDQALFEWLCLEGASVGLSWKTILHKRSNYCKAFHDFDIDDCAKMTDEELESLLSNSGLIRHRKKIFSIRQNAQAVQAIQESYGSFDAYLSLCTIVQNMYHQSELLSGIPTASDLSDQLCKVMSIRGILFVVSVITYSFLQAIGVVNDHLIRCLYR